VPRGHLDARRDPPRHRRSPRLRGEPATHLPLETLTATRVPEPPSAARESGLRPPTSLAHPHSEARVPPARTPDG
jgi:hypothetical protein